MEVKSGTRMDYYYVKVEYVGNRDSEATGRHWGEGAVDGNMFGVSARENLSP